MIITGRMPAVLQVSTASLTSARGGSIMPTKPMKVMSRSKSASSAPSGCAERRRKATASTRCPSLASSSLAASMRWRNSSVIGTASSPAHTWLVISNRPSTAPLVKATKGVSWHGMSVSSGGTLTWWTVVIRLRSEVKGISATRGKRWSSSDLIKPSWAAANTSAPSVGSPNARYRSPSRSARSSTASLHKAEAMTSNLRLRTWGLAPCVSPRSSSGTRLRNSVSTVCVSPITSSTVTVIRFSVRVPVLSEQMTVTEPSVSTAGSLRMSASRLSMRCAPSARPMVTTAGSPSGTAATAILMAVSSISRQFSPRSKPNTKTRPTITKAATANPRPN